MSNVEMLRFLVNQRLSVAVEEIFGLVERTIAEYEEQLCRSKEENERQQKLLDAVFNPQLRLHRAGGTLKKDPSRLEKLIRRAGSVVGMKLDSGDGGRGKNSSAHCRHQPEEPVPPKTAPSQVQDQQTDGLRDKGVSHTVQLLTGGRRSNRKTEDGEEQQPANIRELSENKAEIPSEQQDWSPTANLENMELPRIKEEQEELWSSQEGEEEFHTTKLSISPILVKGEDGEQILQSSQLHQTQTGQMGTGADEEECREEEEARSSDSVSYLEPEAEDKNEDGSEVKSAAYDDWRDREDHQSAFNYLEHFGTRSSNIDRKSNSCVTAFINNQELIQHMTINSREKLFHRSEFDNRFIPQPHLTKHLLRSPGEKILRCSECFKTFKYKSSLTSHMKIHRGEKPFCCSQCDKRFIKRSYLNSHMTVHTGEKPYSCKVCGLRFAWRNQLKRHECLGGLVLVN